MITVNNIYGTDVDSVWLEAIKIVLNLGEECSPRGMKIKEILGLQLRMPNCRANVLMNPKRDLNYKFAIAEWLWMQSGSDDVESIAKYNKNIGAFSDDGSIFYGAYGPRLLRQWSYIVKTLSRDPDSRQAVATIYDPCPPETKDVPCTLSLQWFIRQGSLDCVATMRSSDLWLGLPYDIFNFTQLTNTLAGHLKVPTGNFIITLGSAHLYQHNWEDAAQCAHSPATSITSPTLPGFCDIGVLRDVLRYPNSWLIERKSRADYNAYHSYARALACKTKREALEVLREASNYR